MLQLGSTPPELTRKIEDGRNWARFTFWVAGAALMLNWLTVIVKGNWPEVKAQVGKTMVTFKPAGTKVVGCDALRLLMMMGFPPARGVWVEVGV